MTLPIGEARALALLDEPDEVRTFERGRIEIVRRDPPPFGRVSVEPGWHRFAKPERGEPRFASPPTRRATDTGTVRHAGYVFSGRLAVRSSDGPATIAGPGDPMVIGEMDEAWTVGPEPCVFFDITGAEHWPAGPARTAS